MAVGRKNKSTEVARQVYNIQEFWKEWTVNYFASLSQDSVKAPSSVKSSWETCLRSSYSAKQFCDVATVQHLQEKDVQTLQNSFDPN